MIIDICL